MPIQSFGQSVSGRRGKRCTEIGLFPLAPLCHGHASSVRDGREVQIDPIQPTLKAPGSERLKPKHVEVLSSFAFRFNVRRYMMGPETFTRYFKDDNTRVTKMIVVGRCRLTLSNIC